MDFDYKAARNAGYSDDQILDGLAKNGDLDFDLPAARKAGFSSSDILKSLIGDRAREPEPAAPESSSLLRRAGDVGISALKGVIGVPEALVGLADIPTGGAAGRAAEAAGVKFKQSKELLSDLYSPEQKAANQKVAEADGFVGTAGAMLSNPSTIAQTAIESIPQMGLGGAIGRGVLAVAPKIGALGAAAIGEGAVGGGTAAEQIRQQSGGDLSLGQAGAALASGVGTGIFGLVGGRLAQKLGVADIDTALVQAGAPAGSTKGVIRRMLEGGISEGVFEEVPQSIQEQIWQNAAMDKPLLEGVPEAAAQGLLVGGLFGGVAGGALHGKADAPAATDPQTGQPLLLGNTPDPFISFPDGSVGRKSEFDAFLNGLPEDQRAAARARFMGYEAQPVTPADVLQAESVDQAIEVAQRAVAEGSPEFQAQRGAEIDAAWSTYMRERAAQMQTELTAAEQQRRDADVPAMQAQLADQQVAQAEALTRVQGFDDPAPTAMQMAMQAAQAKRQAAIDAATTPGAADVPPIPVDAAAPADAGPAGNPAGAAALAPAVDTAIPAADSAATAGRGTETAAADVEQARAILTAAGVTGNDRMAALRSIRTGENTLDDLIDAHPPKENTNATPPTAATALPEQPPAGAAASASVQPDTAAARADTAQLDDDAGGNGAVSAGGRGLPAGADIPDGDAARRATASAGLSGNPLQDNPGSWVIRNKETGEVMMETFDRKKVDALNTEKYEAVPAYQHLTEINDPNSKAGRLARGETVAPAAAPVAGEYVPKEGWRKSVTKAREYAKQLGISTKDKSIYALVEQIDETLADTLDNIDVGRLRARMSDPAATAEVMGRVEDAVEAQTGRRPNLTGSDAARQDASAENFQLGQSAEDGLAGQDALFSRTASKKEIDWSNPGGRGLAGTFSRDTKIGDTTISYGVGVDSAEIISVRTPAAKRGAGAARQAMAQFLREADARNLAVKLQASALDKKTSTARLVQFYQSLGFELTGKKINALGDPEMIRPAQNNPRESTGVEPARGMPAAEVTRAIARLRAKWAGFAKVEVVQSVDELPAALRDAAGDDSLTEGLYDPRTQSVYLIADNLASAERAAWVAAHEVVGHGGLRMLNDQTVRQAMKMAGANRFIQQLGAAIQTDRGAGTNEVTALEEAVAELSAATETGDFAGLEARYGVTVPAAARPGIRGVVARVVAAVRQFLATVTGQPVAEVSDADVFGLIGQQQAAVEGRSQAPRRSSAEPARASIPANQRTIEVDGERRPINYSDGTPVADDFAGQVKFWQNFTGEVDSRGRPIREGEDAPRASRAPAAGTERIPKWAESLTDEQKDALRKSGAIYSEKTMRQKIDELREGALKKMQYGIFDQFAPIKDQLGRVPYIMARMAKAADGTLEAMMLYGRPHLDADGGMLVDTTKKGFIETMQALNGEHDQFFSWLAGKRAAQLKKEGRENLFTDTDISSLATLNQGQMKDGTSREAAYLRAQKDVAELNKSVLDIAEASGLIDAESRRVWASDFYVPFFRVMEEGITGPSIKSGLVNQKSVKKLKGGTNNLNDLTKNMLMNWSTLLTASAKNRAAKASLDVAAGMGVASEAPESTIKAMAKSAKTRAVSYMEGGTNRWFVVEDEHLLAAISALEFNGYNNDAMRAMSWFKNALTKAITVSPFFKVRNLIRDSLSVLAVSDINRNPLINLKNGYSLMRDDSVRAQMVAGGGIYRFGMTMEGNRAENVKRMIDDGVADDTILNTAGKMAKFTRKLWGAYEEVGDLSENLNRAALYQKMRDEGKTHLEASFEARDLMDFGLSGAWAGVRALNQILPFFNARLQGMYKLGRGYNDDPKRMGYVIGSLALATIALSAAYKDDDDWKKRSDSDRNNYWWFKVGSTAYRIPKPFEIGAAATAIDHFAALFYDSENTNAERFQHQVGELINGQLAMNPIPQVFRPLIDVYSNKDAFSGRPIESQAMQRLRPEDRYSSNTSELARLLSKSGALVDPVSLVAGTGVKQLSPVQIDSLIKGYFAGVGVLAVSGVDGLLHHTLIDRGAALPMPVRAMTGSFVEDLPTSSSRYVDMLYKTAQDVEQTYASYQNAIKQGDIEKAREIMREEGGTLAKYHMVESLKKNESRINLVIQRVRDDKILTGEQKDEQIRRLKIVQDRIARQMVTGR